MISLFFTNCFGKNYFDSSYTTRQDWSNDNTVTITRCTFTDITDTKVRDGGGLYIHRTDCTITVDDLYGEKCTSLRDGGFFYFKCNTFEGSHFIALSCRANRFVGSFGIVSTKLKINCGSASNSNALQDICLLKGTGKISGVNISDTTTHSTTIQLEDSDETEFEYFNPTNCACLGDDSFMEIRGSSYNFYHHMYTNLTYQPVYFSHLIKTNAKVHCREVLVLGGSYHDFCDVSYRFVPYTYSGGDSCVYAYDSYVMRYNRYKTITFNNAHWTYGYTACAIPTAPEE